MPKVHIYETYFYHNVTKNGPIAVKITVLNS